MRIAVVGIGVDRKGMPEYVKSLAKGMESMGHRVDILNALTADGYSLPGYEYIAVCADAAWGGKTPEPLAKILAAGSGLAGKKSAAFIRRKTPLFLNKSLVNLMKAMEREGMVVNWSDIILSSPHAEALGKRIGA